jgi:hypothetical protein
MPWKTFKAIRPSEPQPRRVLASLDDYYNFEFSEIFHPGMRNRYWSVDFGSDSEFIGLHGFVAKDSAEGKALYELLADGKKHRVVLSVGFLPEPEANTNCVLIHSVTSKSWVY